ncbi:General transcription factor IIE subunit 2 [Holothuria leucospilota]|uniref:Transcription initiation factor IIE subunit beta n=1 Tax=Holothuria leucospilota TaxID=206669 RepID=A0A9Q1C1F3_HOLLE|nr:General transcription factor IIE subunit 2 [Holothuria leucospilota]
MDPALRKERDAFKKRALAQPVVEKKKATELSSEPPKKKKKPLLSGMSAVALYLHTVVDVRHQQGDTFPLTFKEVLDETNQLDISHNIKNWLMNEALPNNPKIALEDGKYVYKPPFKLQGKKDLLRLLSRYDQQGLGGIMMDDIVESLPNAEKCFKVLGSRVIVVTRVNDKKKVVFYNDKSFLLNVDDEFRELWNSTAVESLDEVKIEEYLKKQGISSMQDFGMKKLQKQKKKVPKNRRRKFKKLNDHMGDILVDYTQDDIKKK